MASRIVVLNAGVVEQIGAPLELYHHPNNLFVAGFIGSPKMNFLPGKLVSAEATLARVVLRSGHEVTVAVDATRAEKASEVTLGIRPEHMVHIVKGSPASSELSRVRGEVALVENLGESALIYVRVPESDGLTFVPERGHEHGQGRRRHRAGRSRTCLAPVRRRRQGVPAHRGGAADGRRAQGELSAPRYGTAPDRARGSTLRHAART